MRPHAGTILVSNEVTAGLARDSTSVAAALRTLISTPSVAPILFVIVVWCLCSRCFKTEKRTSSYLSAFGFARYLGAVHIVLFHAYRPEHPFYTGLPEESEAWMSWGFCWVVFYFILSGFMLTYSRYTRKDPLITESTFTIWNNGMSRLYPAYVISILIGLKTAQHTNWRSIPASVLLLQSWGSEYNCTSASWFCVGGGINEPAWFISALQFHYLAFGSVYRVVTTCSGRQLALIACCCVAFIPAAFHLRYAALLPSCHPLLYLHKFVFGMCLCRFFVDRFCSVDISSGKKVIDEGKVAASRPWSQFMVVVGCILLLVLFTASSKSWPMPIANLMLNDSMRTCALFSVFTLLIIGLALEADPLARLFKKAPFIWGDLISYEVYILQLAVIPLAQSLCAGASGVVDTKLAAWVYIGLLHILAAVAHLSISTVQGMSTSAKTYNNACEQQLVK